MNNSNCERLCIDFCNKYEEQAAINRELLEALQNIVTMENTEKNEWDAVEVLIPKMCEIARKAIAKATGEQA